MKLQDTTIIITGAAGGIGSVTAQELAQRGAITVLVDIRAAELQHLAERINAAGGCAVAIPTDITQPSQVEQLVSAVIARYGRIDVLVNGAGVGTGQYFMRSSSEHLQQIIAINLLGPVLCIRAVVPHMRQQRNGLIVNLGSVAGEIGLLGIYSATKFGIRGLSDSLRRELKHDNIFVALVEPGFIDTPMNAEVKVQAPYIYLAPPQVVANAIVNVILKPRHTVIVPWYYRVLVILGKLLPWFVTIKSDAGSVG